MNQVTGSTPVTQCSEERVALVGLDDLVDVSDDLVYLEMLRDRMNHRIQKESGTDESPYHIVGCVVTWSVTKESPDERVPDGARDEPTDH
jgi:hypothetical protein